MNSSSCCEGSGISAVSGTHPGAHEAWFGHDCCCCSGRHFVTRAERLKHLEEYREQVELELRGVQERIAALKTEG